MGATDTRRGGSGDEADMKFGTESGAGNNPTFYRNAAGPAGRPD
ncbi:hypothetical protein BLAT2472_10723 [Burkholderia latens]